MQLQFIYFNVPKNKKVIEMQEKSYTSKICLYIHLTYGCFNRDCEA